MRLKTNPEYLNELIGVLNGSLSLANNRIQKLEKIVGQSNQESLIELQDKFEMLNRRFFNKGKESLNKSRPPKDHQKELLPIMFHLLA